MKRKQRIGFASFGTMKLTFLEGVIISSFFPEAKEMTIKEIMERIDYSYERVNSALKSLSKKKILNEEKKGKTLIYSLDLHHLYSKIGFDHYMLEREIEFIKNHPVHYKAIKEIIENHSILMVVLFGSYSKGAENKQSDLDLLCLPISNKKEAESFISSLKHKYGIKLSCVIIPIFEFQKIKKENPELWVDLKQYGIVFKGEDFFYSWIYKDESS